MKVTGKEVAGRIAAQYGTTLNALNGTTRRTNWQCRVVQEIVWHVRQECPHMSFQMIARLIGNDHTTAVYHYQQRERFGNRVPVTTTDQQKADRRRLYNRLRQRSLKIANGEGRAAI